MAAMTAELMVCLSDGRAVVMLAALSVALRAVMMVEMMAAVTVESSVASWAAY